MVFAWFKVNNINMVLSNFETSDLHMVIEVKASMKVKTANDVRASLP